MDLSTLVVENAKEKMQRGGRVPALELAMGFESPTREGKRCHLSEPLDEHMTSSSCGMA